jgi:lysophospholipid acyltransferase (LPLAT)-like uncharacterized protein
MEMLRKLREQDICFCVTPDGPKGPVYEVHQGIIKLASQTGLPIVPVCIEYEDCWRIRRAWDQYAIPKPCSNVNVLWKKRFFVPSTLTSEQLSEYTERLRGLLSEGLPDFSPIASNICKS